MVDLLGGLFGAMAGAGSAVSSIAEKQQAALAEQLKMQAAQEFAIKMKDAEHQDRLKEIGKTQEGHLELEGKRGQNELAAADRRGEWGIKEADTRGDWALKQEDRRGEWDVKKAGISDATARYVADKSAEGRSKKYVANQLMYNEDGTVSWKGLTADGRVEDIASGVSKDAPKNALKTKQEIREGVDKINELETQRRILGNEATNKAVNNVAAAYGLPVLPEDVVIEKNFWGSDKTEKQYKLDTAGITGLLEGAQTKTQPKTPSVVGMFATDDFGSTGFTPTGIKSDSTNAATGPTNAAAKIREDMLRLKAKNTPVQPDATATTQQPTAQSAVDTKTTHTLEELEAMGNTDTAGKAAATPTGGRLGEEGNIWGLVGRGFDAAKESVKKSTEEKARIMQAFEQKGDRFKDPTKRVLIEQNLRNIHKGITTEELIKLILAAK